jgi:hypothetical protein
MSRKNKILAGVLLGLGVLFISVSYLSKANIAVVDKHEQENEGNCFGLISRCLFSRGGYLFG